MASNVCTPLFRPGSHVTVRAAGAVTGKTFVGVSGARDAGGVIKAKTATAAVRPFGVAAFDAADGAVVTAICGGILPVTADGAITAGDEVEVGASGKAVKLASGIAVGRALDTVASGADVFVQIY